MTRLDTDREGKRTTGEKWGPEGDLGDGGGDAPGEDRSTPHVAGYKSTVLNKL